MQRIQIARGDIKTRQSSLPLLAGEFFIDTSSSTGYQLYIGTGGSSNYEWSEVSVSDGTNTIKGPDGAYKKIGASNALGFAETHLTKESPSYRIKSVPTSPITGGLYIADNDIQISEDDKAKYENLVSDGTAGTPEIKENDILIYTGYKWVILGNSGGSAKTIDFYPNYTQATADVSNIEDAIVAVDGQKLAYKGVLFDSKSITTGATLTLKEGTTLLFDEVVTNADGTTTTTTVGSGVELGTVEGTLWTIDTECRIAGAKYEEGDYLTISTTKAWSDRTEVTGDPNSKKLSSADVVITRMPGGTHKPEKIYIKGSELPRGTTAANTAYANTDAAISNVKEALQVGFSTKADLDPRTKKVLLSQLPDTVVGAMDYQGTYAGGVTVDETKDTVTTVSGVYKAFAGFTLPTYANKSSVDADNTDSSTEDAKTTALVKGDYWIFSSTYKWDITSLVEASTIIASGLSEVDGKYYITNGDWIIYDGDDKWSVIDNTDAFIGIKADEKTLQGTVTIKGEDRTTDLVETDVSVDGQDVTIEVPNAVLAKDGVAENVLYKSGSASDKTAIASNLTDDGTDLTVKESEGLKLTTTVNSEGAEVTATIVGNDASAKLKLPNIDTTLAANEDLGTVDAAEGKAGTDWFATMYRTENSRKVIRNSFLKFLGSEADGKLALTGIELADETLSSHKVDIKLSSDTGHTVQVLPRVSGYLLNTNSIIDCGVWTEDDTAGTAPTEGYVSAENGKLYKNQISYKVDDDTTYQTSEDADSNDLVSDSEKEDISAIIVND